MFRLQCFHLCTTLILFISYIILYCMYYFCEWKLVHHRYFSTEFFFIFVTFSLKKVFCTSSLILKKLKILIKELFSIKIYTVKHFLQS